MSAFAKLTSEEGLVNDGLSSIVVVKDVADVAGGRTLKVDGITDPVIKAGTIIIHDGTDYKPLGITSGAWDSIPSRSRAVGVLKATILTSDPRAAILTMGQVNAGVCPAPITSAIKTALPQINFINE